MVGLLGDSPPILALRTEITRAARTTAKILILGETGTGKEVVARLIHAGSSRGQRPFVAVNCSGIPETLLASEMFGHARGSFTGAYRDKPGLVRQADGGTLFLDELGEMSLGMQAALLRFVETGEIQPVGGDAPKRVSDARLLTATNRDLRAQIAQGQFREDLYYRLNVVELHIPPLRERGHDIVLLFEHYLREASETHGVPCPGISPSVVELLLAYRWPGNVRELRNMTERLVLRDLSALVIPEDLPPELLETPRVPANAVASNDTSVHDADPPSVPAALPAAAPTVAVDRLWTRLMNGEDFWSVVHQPFRNHEITRTDLAALVDRGLQHAGGKYRSLVHLFNLPSRDYKRFHAFLVQQQCNLPVASYRMARTKARSIVAAGR